MTPGWKKQHLNMNKDKGVKEGTQEKLISTAALGQQCDPKTNNSFEPSLKESFGSEDGAAVTASPRCWVEGTGPRHQIHRVRCLPG